MQSYQDQLTELTPIIRSLASRAILSLPGETVDDLYQDACMLLWELHTKEEPLIYSKNYALKCVRNMFVSKTRALYAKRRGSGRVYCESQLDKKRRRTGRAAEAQSVDSLFERIPNSEPSPETEASSSEVTESMHLLIEDLQAMLTETETKILDEMLDPTELTMEEAQRINQHLTKSYSKRSFRVVSDIIGVPFNIARGHQTQLRKKVRRLAAVKYPAVTQVLEEFI